MEELTHAILVSIWNYLSLLFSDNNKIQNTFFYISNTINI